MLLEKFPYSKLTRKNVDNKRLYLCPDGNSVASVTTILSNTKSQESKDALNNWRKRVGHQNAQQITTEAAGRGTRMHSWIENYIATGVIGEPGTNPHSIQSHKMAQTVIKQGLSKVTEFYGSEVQLYFPELYAGTTDVVALYEDEITIIDFKQSNKPKKIEWLEDYFCQMAAYSLAHNHLFGTKITRGINMICTPELQFQHFEINTKNFSEWEDKWWARVHQYYLG
jgi:genome maintenance exonuclease 1